MRYLTLLFLCLLSFPEMIYAQKIDNLASFRNLESESYFRFNYDNDYFAATDKNYTQGYSLEFVVPCLIKNPVNHLFFRAESSSNRYGIAVEHIGFTPRNIESPEIQEGDRPFAAAIMLKSFLISTNFEKRSRFTSSFSLGIIGPGAFGKEMQVGIHKATGNVIPEGWRNQIRNDVVLNYEVGYEKQLFRYRNFLSVQRNSNLQVGTLFTNASVGFNSVAGLINSPFSSEEKQRKFQLYLYAQPLVKIVGYDATLQGGLFSNASPYTIPAGEVERFVGQINYGVVFKINNLYLEYTRTTINREFETGNSANWGGIKLGFGI
ncbi:lipid A deacylase LpxR family protein [Gillisia limnaea]|uniref:Lipid A deacylase LpxR family protein n=1 Tax=Gillisia limnaea (strain DSM 15749 / LMG 21470 / R-8282) TaxID=865937 RepID=H2BSK6_GILLR|nr:lipid A deacylase LpxR family protein [Gillisia limnaea]EHQ02553.1 Protein of unknown function DUF2219 [Gillisia limnaea DSM 15749]